MLNKIKKIILIATTMLFTMILTGCGKQEETKANYNEDNLKQEQKIEDTKKDFLKGIVNENGCYNKYIRTDNPNVDIVVQFTDNQGKFDNMAVGLHINSGKNVWKANISDKTSFNDCQMSQNDNIFYVNETELIPALLEKLSEHFTLTIYYGDGTFKDISLTKDISNKMQEEINKYKILENKDISNED